MNARGGLVAVLLTACGVTGPVPLEWNEAGCTHCHMTLADRRYGAEIITTNGRALVFDDAGCAAEALATRELGVDEVSSVWVIDFTHPDSLIDANSATFVRSKEFKTPMGSGVIATSDPVRADSLARAVGGELLDWPQLLASAERDFLGAH